MHHLFAPNHVQLVSACYPPTSTLLTSGPDYRPNAQELSRLTYYACNRPGKINKLCGELEKRVRQECRKAAAGNLRGRALLLMSLAIFKALATECRRDIALLTPALLSALDITLASLPRDLEVCARAASVFTTWATYTDGHLLSVNVSAGQSYLSTLNRLANLALFEPKNHDEEVRNRTRLIGLASLTGVVNSEALYSKAVNFGTQVSAIVEPIILNMLQAQVPTLVQQAARMKDSPVSPYLEEFRTRPALERRALSIHIHRDGDEGPSSSDVTNACLHVLSSLLRHTNGVQLGHIMQAAFENLDHVEGWDIPDCCCWLAEKACEWAQYQYRYAIPTRLVERLVEKQDIPLSSSLPKTLTAMIQTVLRSPIALINLSTSDVIANLTTVVLRRVAIDPNDPLLPSLVECIASLGTHVYYSDQIQDLAGELISRLTSIEVQGLGRDKAVPGRSQAIRCLLAALLGLMESADEHEMSKLPESSSTEDQNGLASSSKSSPPSPDPGSKAHARLPSRTRIAPEIWQDTMSLLCDFDFGVRADYARALIHYLRREIPKRGDSLGSEGVKRTRTFVDGPLQQLASASLIVYGDSVTRLLHALHSYAFMLALNSSLGLGSGSMTPTSHSQSVNGDVPPVTIMPATPLSEGPTSNGDTSEPRESQAYSRRSMTWIPRPRKASVVQQLLDGVPNRISGSAAASASDYTHILAILITVQEELPVRGLLIGIPMLLALDGALQSESMDAETAQRAKIIREIIARVWMVIGTIWNHPDLKSMADQALSSMPGPSSLPPMKDAQPGIFYPAEEPIQISQSVSQTDGETCWTGLNAENALTSIVSSKKVQDATGLDRQGLLRRFANKWTPEIGLEESVERPATHDMHRGDGISPLLKISPALMQIENMSLQSLARSTRGVGVTDLREALEGRSSMSNPALVKPPSISTLDHASTVGESTHRVSPRTKISGRRPSSAGPTDVRDVLNRLGIGKQNGNSLLKASFPHLQKGEERSSTITPPYKR